MIASLAKLMDWLSMQAAVLMTPASDLDSKLEEAVQFLKGRDFIPTESQPARVEFNGGAPAYVKTLRRGKRNE